MTVPSLMQNYQRQSYVTQLHKFYNELSQSLSKWMTDKNALNLAEVGVARSEDMMPFMKEYFKVIQDCDTTPTPCFASSYKNLNGAAYTLTTRGGKCGVIASGASFCIFMDGLDTGTVANDDFLGQVWVDINGQKGPNIYGRDLFIMYFFPDAVVDEYRINPDCRINNNCNGQNSPQAYRDTLFASCKNATGGGYTSGCFAKILNDNWQMTY